MSASLTIVPLSGLCNRIRVMTSMMEANLQLNCEVQFLWERNAACFAHFEELFLPLHQKGVSVLAGSLSTRIARKRNLMLPYLWRRFSYDCQLSDYDYRRGAPLRELCAKYRHLYLTTCLEVAPYREERAAAYFVPRPELQQEIDLTAASFTPHTVGIHVRRTDHREAISQSPLKAFYLQMEKVMSADAGATFFLASDDAEVKEKMTARFGSRILTRHKATSRTTLEGMQEAVIDLWCLSRTKSVVGSYGSSYSGTAAELGNIPLITITKP